MTSPPREDPGRTIVHPRSTRDMFIEARTKEVHRVQERGHVIDGDLYLSFIVDTCRFQLLTNHNNGDLMVIQWDVMGLILW